MAILSSWDITWLDLPRTSLLVNMKVQPAPITGKRFFISECPMIVVIIILFSFLSMMVYLAEMSTPFLNISWLLNYLKLDNSLPLSLCGIILLVTFFFCRIILGPFLFYHMIYNWTSEPRFLFYINVVMLQACFMLSMKTCSCCACVHVLC